MCCDISRVISFDEVVCLRIFYGFKTCLIAWRPHFMKPFLHTRTKSSWTSSQISKGGVFSFLHLCLNLCIGYKVNVVERGLLLGFSNAFAFVLYSRMFAPFTRYTPSVAFFNGGYNYNLRGFLLESTTLSHPFFWCSLIYIFEFFLQ